MGSTPRETGGPDGVDSEDAAWAGWLLCQAGQLAPSDISGIWQQAEEAPVDQDYCDADQNGADGAPQDQDCSDDCSSGGDMGVQATFTIPQMEATTPGLDRINGDSSWCNSDTDSSGSPAGQYSEDTSIWVGLNGNGDNNDQGSDLLQDGIDAYSTCVQGADGAQMSGVGFYPWWSVPTYNDEEMFPYQWLCNANFQPGASPQCDGTMQLASQGGSIQSGSLAYNSGTVASQGDCYAEEQDLPGMDGGIECQGPNAHYPGFVPMAAGGTVTAGVYVYNTCLYSCDDSGGVPHTAGDDSIYEEQIVFQVEYWVPGASTSLAPTYNWETTQGNVNCGEYSGEWCLVDIMNDAAEEVDETPEADENVEEGEGGGGGTACAPAIANPVIAGATTGCELVTEDDDNGIACFPTIDQALDFTPLVMKAYQVAQQLVSSNSPSGAWSTVTNFAGDASDLLDMDGCDPGADDNDGTGDWNSQDCPQPSDCQDIVDQITDDLQDGSFDQFFGASPQDSQSDQDQCQYYMGPNVPGGPFTGEECYGYDNSDSDGSDDADSGGDSSFDMDVDSGFNTWSETASTGQFYQGDPDVGILPQQDLFLSVGLVPEGTGAPYTATCDAYPTGASQTAGITATTDNYDIENPPPPQTGTAPLGTSWVYGVILQNNCPAPPGEPGYTDYESEISMWYCPLGYFGTSSLVCAIQWTEGIGADGVNGLPTSPLSVPLLKMQSELTVSVVVSPPTFTIDQGQPFSATMVVSGGSGGDTYSWTGLPAPCASTAISFTCTPTVQGGYVFSGCATDSAGASACGSGYININPPLAVTVDYEDTFYYDIDIGQTARYVAVATGGTYQYSYFWNVFGTSAAGLGCPYGDTSNTFLLACSNPANLVGNYSDFADLWVSDGVETVVVDPIPFMDVSADPTMGNGPVTMPNPAGQTIELGQNVTFYAASVIGGFCGQDGMGCSYEWQLSTSESQFGCADPYPTPGGYQSGPSSTFTCTPTAVGVYPSSPLLTAVVELTFVDATGGSSPIYQSPSIVTVVTQTTVTLTETSGSIYLGGSVAFTATAVGGTGPGTYSWSWSGLPPGCSLPVNTASTSTVVCTPTLVGDFSVSASATDGLSYTGTGTIALWVLSPYNNLLYLQEAGSIAQINGIPSQDLTSAGVTVTMVNSPYPTTYGFVGVSNTGDSYEVAIADNWPGCDAGFEMYYIYYNAAGSVVGSACDPTLTISPGDSVELYLTVSGSDVCLEAYDFTTSASQTDCVAQPDPASGTNPYDFVPGTSDLSATNDFTGPMTEVLDNPSLFASACQTIPALGAAGTPGPNDLPQVNYEWPDAGGVTVSQYIEWSQQWQEGSGLLCSQYASQLFTPSPGYYGTNYVQAAPSYGPHWLAGQNVGNPLLGYSWLFSTDDPPASPDDTTISATQSSLDVGQADTLTPTTPGGTPPYSYEWFVNGAYQATTTGPWVWSPPALGTYDVWADTIDASGNLQGPSNTLVLVANGPALIVTTPTASANPIDLGVQVTFSESASGGYGTLSYTWSGVPPGCGGGIGGIKSSIHPTLTCTPTAAGTYSVTVTVMDSNGNSATSPALTFVVNPGPIASPPVPSLPSIDVGQSVVFSTIVTGGTGPFTYTWTESSLSFGCVLSNAASIVCVPTAPSISTGNVAGFTVTVVVTDSLGVASAPATSASYPVYSDPIVNTIVPIPPSIDVGQTTLLGSSSSGGSGGDTFSWSGLPPGCSSVNAASLSCTPSAAGTYYIVLAVTDSNGYTAYSPTLTLVVYPPLMFGSGPSAPEIASVSAGSYPWDSDVDSSNHMDYVVNTIDGPGIDVYEVNLATDSVVGTISSNFIEPRGVWYDDATGDVWVAYFVSGVVAEFNAQTGTLVTSIAACPGSLDLVYDPNHNALWVTCYEYGEVAEVSLATDTVVTTLATNNAYPYFLAMDPTTNLIFVTDTSGNNEVQVINAATQSFVGTVNVPNYPYSEDLVILPTQEVLVTSTGGGTISEFSESNFNQVTTVAGPAGAFGIGYDGPLGLLAVGGQVSSTVQFYCASTLAQVAISGPVPYVNGPFALGFDTTLNVLAVGTDNGGNSQVQVYNVAGLAGVCPGSVGASTVTATPSTLDAHQHLALTSIPVSGGTGVYSYVWLGLPPGCVSTNAPSLSCNPTTPGTYSASLQVTDSNGYTITSSGTTVTVLSDVTTSTPIASPSSVDVGQTTTIYVAPAGGSGSYSYAWNGLPTGCSTVNNVVISCTPTAAGTFSISVTVTDTLGYSVTSATLSFTVYTDPSLTTPTAVPPSGGIDAGQTATFSSTTSGGSGGNSYVWTGLPPVGLPNGCPSANALHVSCKFASPGTYHVQISLTDSNGYAATSGVLTYVVDTDPTITAPVPSTESFAVGQTSTISVVASGGSGGFHYTWTISSTNLGCGNQNGVTFGPTISCVPKAAGSYAVNVTATDSNGYSVNSPVLKIAVFVMNSGSLCSVSKGQCTFTGSSHCTPAMNYQFNGSYQALAVTVTGSSNCLFFNVSGSHDVLNFAMTGGSIPYFQLIVAGQHDFVNLNVIGSSDNAYIYVFGQSDVYNFTATGNSNTAKTYFLGFVAGNDTAPYLNTSNTDTWHLSIVGSSNLQYLTYVNSVGWATAAHQVADPKGMATGSSDDLVYQNLTGVWTGPWGGTAGVPSFIPSTPAGAIPKGNAPWT